MPHCFGNVTRFFGIKRARRPLAYCAKSTMTRADIAAEHECRRAIRPALEDVRTFRFLANRVQVQTLNQVEQMVLIGWITQTNPEPLGFRLTWFGIQNLKFAAQESFTLKLILQKHS